VKEREQERECVCFYGTFDGQGEGAFTGAAMALLSACHSCFVLHNSHEQSLDMNLCLPAANPFFFSLLGSPMASGFGGGRNG